MLADTDLVVSVADVAITVTVLPGGIAVGAVYVDGTPLAVKAGLNDPQGEAPQVTVQFTWGFAVTSFVICARMDIEEPTCIEAGGAPENVTEIGMGGTILMTAEAESEGSATEVAVTVTVPPEGIAGGAVNRIAPPSSLGFNVPQAPGLAQLIAYVTALFSSAVGT